MIFTGVQVMASLHGFIIIIIISIPMSFSHQL